MVDCFSVVVFFFKCLHVCVWVCERKCFNSDAHCENAMLKCLKSSLTLERCGFQSHAHLLIANAKSCTCACACVGKSDEVNTSLRFSPYKMQYSIAGNLHIGFSIWISDAIANTIWYDAMRFHFQSCFFFSRFVRLFRVALLTQKAETAQNKWIRLTHTRRVAG